MPAPIAGTYTKDQQYTGLPYSSTKHVGRAIGEEIFFKTFVAALANPLSVLYTENLSEYGDLDPDNATTYYGVVCSKLTSYGLKNGTSVLSRFHGPEDPGDPDNRRGVIVMHELTATDYDISVTPPRVGDIMWYMGHTRMITGVTKPQGGAVTKVEISESTRDTARTTTRTATQFESALNGEDPEYGLLRIVDFDAWRGDNKSWLFPDFDREIPTINSVLLLDRGDWVPYTADQPVKINILDSDAETLVVSKAGQILERIALSGTGVIERTLTDPGQYTAHCIMSDGSASQACEFAIVATSITVASSIDASTDFDVSWSVTNATPRFVFVRCLDDITKRYFYFLGDADRAAGKITIPGGDVNYTGAAWIVVVSENELGRVSSIDNGVTFT